MMKIELEREREELKGAAHYLWSTFPTVLTTAMVPVRRTWCVFSNYHDRMLITNTVQGYFATSDVYAPFKDEY